MPHDSRMVIIKDGSPSFTCRCCVRKDSLSPFTETVWADINGKAFVDYYCNNCKNLEEEKSNG